MRDARLRQCFMASAKERSEGELSSSEEKSEPVAKKVKIAADNDEPGANHPLEELAPRTRKKRCKKEKRKGVKKGQETLSRHSSKCLTFEQAQLLEQLISLVQPPSSSSLSSPQSVTPASSHSSHGGSGSGGDGCGHLMTMKTGKFQEVLLHVLLGEPGLPRPLGGLEELRRHRLAIVWLSMVSAQLFLSSPNLFSGLKALRPSVQFFLQHPGSAYFAKLGLEAMLLSPEEKQESSHVGGEPTGPASKGRCLLSLVDMRLNNFPGLPLGEEDGDEHSEERESQWSGYFKLSDVWPSDTAEVDSYPMFALDCEMVLTGQGLELARISLVNEAYQCVYDTLVKPENPILDYKTQFSGITKETLEGVLTTLADVHRRLGELLPQKCILVGHSLESDLHALKMAHPYVIDTSCLFQPSPPSLSKPKLSVLTKKFLDYDIQTSSEGHNSIEDAVACMKLVQRKMEDWKGMVVSCRRSQSILTEVAARGRSVGIVDRAGITNLFGSRTLKHHVRSDGEAVKKAAEVISSCELTFLQLHAMEDHLKGPDPDSEVAMAAAAEELDASVLHIVSGCPGNTLVVVVCGSSNIREVRRLQQARDSPRLREAVSVARTGLATAFLVT